MPGAVIGGLDQWATLQDGRPEQAPAQARGRDRARRAGAGSSWARGCVLANGTSDLTLVS